MKLLKEILAIPTITGRETLMTEWLMTYLKKAGCHVRKDEANNVYATKGVSTLYPCVCAHTDTVHHPKNVMIVDEGDKLFAVDWTGVQVGCGGDDKAGIYICLEMLETLPVLKAVFFAGEEMGCIGSRQCNEEFFTNVGYVLEFDSPCDDIVTYTCDGTRLFPLSGDFYDIMWSLFQKYGTLNWQRHPYTDVSILRRKFSFPCLNLPAGYFRMHSDNEYVQMSVVDNSISLGTDLVNKLGAVLYAFPRDTGETDNEKPPVLVTGLRTHDFGSRPAMPSAGIVPVLAPATITQMSIASKIGKLRKTQSS